MLSIKFSLLLGILHVSAGGPQNYKKNSERLWKVLEANALAPTVSESVHPVCYRSNVSMNQQLVAKQLKQLLEVDASLNDYLTNGQACTGGPGWNHIKHQAKVERKVKKSLRKHQILLRKTLRKNKRAKRVRRDDDEDDDDRDDEEKKNNQNEEMALKAIGRLLPPGTIIEYSSCWDKNHETISKTLNMCHECIYTLRLPSNYHPRNHFGVTCNNNWDASCLTGEGVCVSNYNVITVQVDRENKGRERRHEWAETTIQISKSCSCQIFAQSFLADFV